MKHDYELMVLLRRTASLSRRLRRERGGETGEKKHIRGMGHILDCLSRHEGKSQKMLAEELGVRPQSLTQALMLLQTRGEIRRETSESDRRVTLVFLTEEGAAHREERRSERLLHAENFFSPLNEKEKKEMVYLLEKINASHEEKEVAKCPHP